jgi:hypothetical protein
MADPSPGAGSGGFGRETNSTRCRTRQSFQSPSGSPACDRPGIKIQQNVTHQAKTLRMIDLGKKEWAI